MLATVFIDVNSLSHWGYKSVAIWVLHLKDLHLLRIWINVQNSPIQITYLILLTLSLSLNYKFELGQMPDPLVLFPLAKRPLKSCPKCSNINDLKVCLSCTHNPHHIPLLAGHFFFFFKCQREKIFFYNPECYLSYSYSHSLPCISQLEQTKSSHRNVFCCCMK